MIPGCIITNEVTKNKCMCADQVIYENMIERIKSYRLTISNSIKLAGKLFKYHWIYILIWQDVYA